VRGFSLVELLMSLAIMLLVCHAAVGFINRTQAIFAVQAELPDMQQRLRVATDALARDLLAGSGEGFASIAPYRRGLASPDLPGTFRGDCVSVLYVRVFGARATLSEVTDGSDVVRVGARPGCPASNPLCGFQSGMLAVVFDDAGASDMFRISGVANDPPSLFHVGFALSKVYPAGATVAEAESATYWLQADAVTGASQLMRYDGQQTDLPLIDNVTALGFEYFDGSGDSIDRAALTDGPWIPDSTFANRFDADLLRVRRVRATVRVRANQFVLLAPVADKAAQIDISPRSRGAAP
jgi:prepilin-type N-terminal cleavage/methylation domain-containing protein